MKQLDFAEAPRKLYREMGNCANAPPTSLSISKVIWPTRNAQNNANFTFEMTTASIGITFIIYTAKPDAQ